MRIRLFHLATAGALLLVAGAAIAQAPAGGPPPNLAAMLKTSDPRSNPPTPAQVEVWKKTFPSGSGPYGAVREEPQSLPTNTIFYPKNLAKVPGKLPIISFANGACSGASVELSEMYAELASQGFFVATIGRINGGIDGGDASLQIKAIDWAIAENSRPGSPFFGKLDTTKIGISGQSCGGLITIKNAGDPRVTTVVLLNSGIISGGMRSGPAGAPAGAPVGMPAGLPTPAPGSAMAQTKDALKSYHSSVAYFLGGPKDIAYANGVDDFSRIEGVPVFLGSTDVGHLATYGSPSAGEFGKVAGDWFKYRLKNDPVAARQFVGPDCGLCTNAKWTVQRKNM